jgi:plasmid stabilization system protein ParE
MSHVQFHPLVEDETVSAARYYKDRQDGLDLEFLAEVDSAIVRASEAPLTGAPIQGNIRRLAVRRFPSNVVYRVETEAIFVISVMHQRRHHSYWQDRVS